MLSHKSIVRCLFIVSSSYVYSNSQCIFFLRDVAQNCSVCQKSVFVVLQHPTILRGIIQVYPIANKKLVEKNESYKKFVTIIEDHFSKRECVHKSDF